VFKKLNIEDIRKEFKDKGKTLITEIYINSKQSLDYICKNGHKHHMRIDHLRSGVDCPYCNGMAKKSIEKIKPYFSIEGYELLSDAYENAFGELICKCKLGHVFKTTWHSWSSSKNRCPICNKGVRFDFDIVKKDIEDGGYELITTEYINSAQILHTKCPKNHDYFVNFGNWKHKKSRCPRCSGNGASSPEYIIREFLDINNINYLINDKKIIAPYELDIVIQDKKIAIEYCGLYWHSESKGKHKNYHLNKFISCKEKGYRLITIFEDEYIFNYNVVKYNLNSILKLDNIKTKQLTNYNIIEVSNTEAKVFFNKNSFIGCYADTDIKLGIFINGNLVGVGLFSYQNSDNYLLIGFCSNMVYRKRDILFKIIEYFKINHRWKTISVEVDKRWYSGDIFYKLGFDFIKIIKPISWNFKSKKRVVNKIKDINYDKIWDCGKNKYMLKNRMELT